MFFQSRASLICDVSGRPSFGCARSGDCTRTSKASTCDHHVYEPVSEAPQAGDSWYEMPAWIARGSVNARVALPSTRRLYCRPWLARSCVKKSSFMSSENFPLNFIATLC